MLDYVKKYIYIELLILLRALNYWIPLDRHVNIVIILYLTFLGIIYLTFRFSYGNQGKTKNACTFRGKHVCIVGGSEGLGFSLAKRIVREKPHTLTIMSRNVNKLRNTKKVLLEEIYKERNGERNSNDGDGCMCTRINIIKCDIGMKESINEAFENVIRNNSLDKENDNEENVARKSIHLRNKAIDLLEPKEIELNNVEVLICNAAYVCTEENNKLQMYDLIYTVNTNIYGNIDVISRVISYMKRKKEGLILFINSEGALYPVYGYSYYLMSKACLWTYTYILDQELKYFNIHFTNAFLPSVETPGFAKENLKKPYITKKIEDLTCTVNSDYAADKVVQKVKKGKKFITLDFNGFMLSVLHSGYRNPESYFDYLICVSFCGFFIFVSSLYKLYIEHIIKRNLIPGRCYSRKGAT
ncbi:hypothetical protein, conserved [Plasmodium gonderi]|uniref:Uncharacterized protein n=1 Tax=Plasmodium gonderi TaxID=77519 RepID=A0A1Y1JGS6_PLAGO|nr:hypothetical protein, conserved [Plasmodium gonderi]GAW79274.1 hypothetical protein, conserved [Plasmodium gonderi]